MRRHPGDCIFAGKPGLGDPAQRLPATRTRRHRSCSGQATSSPRSRLSQLLVSMANVNSSGCHRHRRGTEIALGGGSGPQLAPPPARCSLRGAYPTAGRARRSWGRGALWSLQAWAHAPLTRGRGRLRDSGLALRPQASTKGQGRGSPVQP